MRLLSCVVAAIVLVGCAHGTPFKWDQAREIKPGMTKAEVTARLGKPYMTKSTTAGMRYVWTEVNGLTFASKSLAIDFNTEGQVIGAPPIPDEYQD